MPEPPQPGPIVRTVLGDVDPAALGSTNYHEHLFQTSPLLPGDELADEALSAREAQTLYTAGTHTMVEATPTGLGRDVEATARISVATGLQIVHVTGAHHAAHYAADDELLSATEADLAERFTSDVRDGFSTDDRPALTPDGRPVRAGMVKAAIRYWSIGPFERRVLAAAAATHVATGVPVMVHLDHGSAAHEVLDLLAAAGVAEHRVVLAHLDRLLDPGLHVELAGRGAYLGYDGMARHREAPDSAIIACLADTTAEPAGASRVVLGGDVARASRYRAYGGLPGLDYLATRFLPRLTAALGADLTHRLTTANPARLLAFTPPTEEDAR